MRAMILAAGKGTRLRPVTDKIPKALVSVGGITLLERLVMKMSAAGIREIIVNVHHFPCQIREFLEKNNSFGVDITLSDESEELLDTGGGLVKASWFFRDGGPFLVHNVDVISGIDFQDLFRQHAGTGSLATLAVSRRKTSRYLLTDKNGKVRGWKNLGTGEQVVHGDPANLQPLAFSGIQVISPEIFPLISGEGRFSLVSAYLSLAHTGRIATYLHDPGHWFDAGKISDLEHIESKIKLT